MCTGCWVHWQPHEQSQSPVSFRVPPRKGESRDRCVRCNVFVLCCRTFLLHYSTYALTYSNFRILIDIMLKGCPVLWYSIISKPTRPTAGVTAVSIFTLNCCCVTRHEPVQPCLKESERRWLWPTAAERESDYGCRCGSVLPPHNKRPLSITGYSSSLMRGLRQSTGSRL